MDKLLIVDVSNIIYNAYYALGYNKYTQYRDPNGNPVWVIHGLMRTLKGLLDNMGATHCLIAKDSRYNSFVRRMIYKGYKAGRKSKEDDLSKQFHLIDRFLFTCGLKVIEVDGYEADDIIGTAVSIYRDKFDRIDIFTADKDICQLVDGEKVSVYLNNKKGDSYMKMEQICTTEQVKERYGVKPHLIPDLFGLIGDSSDGIPSVNGIALSTAVELFDQGFTSLERMYESISYVEGTSLYSKEEIQKRLLDGKDQAIMAKRLASFFDMSKLVNFPDKKDLPINLNYKSILRTAEGAGVPGLNKYLELDSKLTADILTKIEILSKALIVASDSYYRAGTSSMSDYDFDMAIKELEKLEKEYGYSVKGSPTGAVGEEKNVFGEKVKHYYPMLSLDNVYSVTELLNWVKGITDLYPKATFVQDIKFDGISLSLDYVEGNLVRAVTRGDGVTGYDITDNAKMISGVPITLKKPATCTVRGEAIISKKDFAEINADGEFANPRNAASCIRSSKDPTTISKRRIQFVPYILLDEDTVEKLDEFQRLDSYGFKTFGSARYLKRSEMEHYIYIAESNKDNHAVPADGLVITVDEKVYRDQLGEGTKFPKWAVAYKFKPDSALSTIQSIEWQVGRRGRLTPVANITPVDLSGSIVKRASIHNIGFIETKNLKPGDRVYVAKAAEIIPEIIDTHESNVKGEINRPDCCPSCGGELVMNGAYIECHNEECPERVIQNLEYICSRDIMYMEGFGIEVVREFYQKRGWRTLYDILTDKLDGVESYEGFGQKSKEKLLDTISSIKDKADLYRVLASFAIPLASVKTCKGLAQNNEADNFLSGNIVLENEHTIVSKNILRYFKDNKEYVSKLFGILNIENSMNIRKSDKFKGLKFCISGSLPVQKKHIEKDVLENGGIMVGSVSKNTDYLICEESGTNKYRDAKKNGVTILSYKEFKQRV